MNTFVTVLFSGKHKTHNNEKKSINCSAYGA